MRVNAVKLLGLAAMLGALLGEACAAGAPSSASTHAVDAAKISPEVAAAAQALAAGHVPPAPARGDDQGRLQVYIYVTQPPPDAVATLAALGTGNPMFSQSLSLVEGWLRPQDLGRIAALPFVTRISLPRYARPH
jgi:hypothetical protein